jgi:hypothetical protein
MYKPKIYGVVSAVIACVLMALPAAAGSQARIVRLSDVQGGVQINKNSGLGFENAFLNLPVTQGTQLRTRDNGRAEIEFEDGSTLRLAPNTTVEFSALGLNDQGKRISAVNLVAGLAYVNWLGKSGDLFTLDFSRERIELIQPAHFRVATSPGKSQVASFKNEIDVATAVGTAVKIEKKKMVIFDESTDQPSVAKNLSHLPADEWDADSTSYHDQYAKNNSTPLGYGVSDLNYYGSYSNVAGYGTLWQPYFSGVGWNPFMDGAWSWYPGMGFMWASAYPWGWMPYYYGNWLYAPGFGWGWQPGAFTSWNGGIHYLGAVSNFQAPVAPKDTVNSVVVGRTAAALAGAQADMIVKKGSAGLGIPRGALTDMHELNSHVAKAGFVQVSGLQQFSASSPRLKGFDFGEEHAEGLAGPGRPGAAANAAHSSGASAAGGHR